MKTFAQFRTLLVTAAFLPLAAAAQPPDTPPANNTDSKWESHRQFGPEQGNFEFTISGSGTSNKQINNSQGGADLSLGSYFTNSTEVLVRQQMGYSHPPGSKEWNGSTKVALDQLLIFSGAFRPYLGVNVGAFYGSDVRDTAGAGLEGGLKFYALRKTFIFAGAEYDWFFRQLHGLVGKTKFNEGEWNWSIGVGFNF